MFKIFNVQLVNERPTSVIQNDDSFGYSVTF